MVSSNYFYLIMIIICLHTVIWVQVNNNPEQIKLQFQIMYNYTISSIPI